VFSTGNARTTFATGIRNKQGDFSQVLWSDHMVIVYNTRSGRRAYTTSIKTEVRGINFLLFVEMKWGMRESYASVLSTLTPH